MKYRYTCFLMTIVFVLGLLGTDIIYAKDNIDAYFEDEYEGESNYYRTTTRTKKGIQEAYSYSGVYEDLGISHTLINVCLNQLLEGSVKHVYQGKTYYFNYIPNLNPDKVKELNENDVCVTLVLLMKMDSRSLSHNLIYSGALGNKSKLYYAWNVYDASATQTLAALMDFLASTYGKADCHIDNWVVGNEVNMPNAWNYTGTTNLSANVDIAARSFVLVDNAIKKYNTGAKAYLSLDHSWTHNDEGRGIAGKTFLDAFAVRLNELKPGIDWNIAYHLYSPIMTDSNIWNSRNANKYTTNNLWTDFISAKNLNVLTDYVKETYGEQVRIILSEQGFTMYGGQEAKQAAALAYTYYAAEFNDMVDATMFRSLKDAPEETKDKFYFGLLNGDGSKRQAYNVFKYMDTDQWQTYTAGCLGTIGISLWNELVTYFDGERFVLKPIEELVLEKSGTVIAVGYKEKLKYEVYPEFAAVKELKWISNDESVVTIDANSGEMTAVAPGRTVIMAAAGGVELATCIVVVKDANESAKNVEKFVNWLYIAAYGDIASKEDLQSYRERLMSRNLTGADVAYEVLAGKEAMNPSKTNEEYVKLMYKALLGYGEKQIPEGMVEMYCKALSAGMSKETVMADIISTTEFDYRCYDFDIDTGKISDMAGLKNIYMLSYNRDLDVTCEIVDIMDIMLHRLPEKEELKGLCSKMLSGKINRADLIRTIFESDEFAGRYISDKDFVNMLYELCEMETVNDVVKNLWVAVLGRKEVLREQIFEEFMQIISSEET